MLRRILLAAAALVVALVGIAYLLPRNVHVERSIEIAAPPSAVFAMLNGFARFNEFSPWAQYDPNAKYLYRGPSTGVGARLEWSGDPKTVGKGSQEIIAVEPDRLVHIALDFGVQGRGEARWLIEESGEGSQVTWAFDTDVGWNPVSRYFGLFFDRWIGADYEKGLAKLKDILEAEAGTRASPEEEGAADADAADQQASPGEGADPADATEPAAGADAPANAQSGPPRPVRKALNVPET
jgi:uncharacterized protein YndB with AHSA1/START domain